MVWCGVNGVTLLDGIEIQPETFGDRVFRLPSRTAKTAKLNASFILIYSVHFGRELNV